MSIEKKFPNDENGAVLQQLWDTGDSLEDAREFDFGAVFSSEEDAMEYAVILLKNGMKVSMEESEEQSFPWLVSCHPFMVPNHEEIGNLESQLKELAEELNGEYDGWDCYFVGSRKE